MLADPGVAPFPGYVREGGETPAVVNTLSWRDSAAHIRLLTWDASFSPEASWN
jgi:hypothetical protein